MISLLNEIGLSAEIINPDADDEDHIANLKALQYEPIQAYDNKYAAQSWWPGRKNWLFTHAKPN